MRAANCCSRAKTVRWLMMDGRGLDQSASGVGLDRARQRQDRVGGHQAVGVEHKQMIIARAV